MDNPLIKKESLPYLAFGFFLTAYAVFFSIFAARIPCWHDECHFIDTILLFMTEPTLHTLQHYNEMSTPLPFVLYALWGTIAGDTLVSLRIFSLLITVITCLVYFFLFTRIFSRPAVSLLLTMFLALHPYMIGAGVLVYTDMLCMLFEALLLIAVMKRSPGAVFFVSACGLLSRQYFAFASVAAFLYCLWSFFTQKNRRDLASAIALVASLLPILALFVFWKGFCPVNLDRTLYMTKGLAFHPNAATLYCVQVFAYLAPIVVIFWKQVYWNRARMLLSLTLCWLYWVYPVAPSEVGLAVDITTLGYFHKLLRIWPGERFEHVIFFICFLLALPIILSSIAGLYYSIKNRKSDLVLLFDLSVLAFLVIMPCSYLSWEKYFLPMLPLVAMRIVAARIPMNIRNGTDV